RLLRITLASGAIGGSTTSNNRGLLLRQSLGERDLGGGHVRRARGESLRGSPAGAGIFEGGPRTAQRCFCLGGRRPLRAGHHRVIVGPGVPRDNVGVDELVSGLHGTEGPAEGPDPAGGRGLGSGAQGGDPDLGDGDGLGSGASSVLSGWESEDSLVHLR